MGLWVDAITEQRDGALGIAIHHDKALPQLVIHIGDIVEDRERHLLREGGRHFAAPAEASNWMKEAPHNGPIAPGFEPNLSSY